MEALVGIAAAVVVFSTFMSWASLFIVSVTGIRTGDGKIVFAVGVVGLILVGVRWRLEPRWLGRRTFSVVETALALVVVVTWIVDAADLGDVADTGIYVAIIAGFAWVLFAALAFRQRSTPAGAA
jgi:hypothetical protein